MTARRLVAEVVGAAVAAGLLGWLFDTSEELDRDRPASMKESP